MPVGLVRPPPIAVVILCLMSFSAINRKRETGRKWDAERMTTYAARRARCRYH